MSESKHIIVIADDITGAAEMAGIAFRHGLHVQLTTQALSLPDSTEDLPDVLVIATDTRSMTEAEAVAETLRIVSSLYTLNPLTSPNPSCRRGILPLQGESEGVTTLNSQPSTLDPRLSTLNPIHFSLFKKTDSALRGHVVAELEALLASTDYKKACYIPANPSKGRIIRNGIYYIGSVPIHETDFSFDPEFPAVSSRMDERFPHCEEKDICWMNATCEEDIKQAVALADEHTLLAGAADLFTAFIEARCSTLDPQPSTTNNSDYHLSFSIYHLAKRTPTLIVCGSTQSKPLDIGIPVCPMPLSVYNQETDAEKWIASLMERLYPSSPSLILTIPHHHRTGKEIAVHLRTVMGKVVQKFVQNHPPQELIIEGGATAWQILQQLGWQNFDITDEIAPGVIRMRALGTDTFVTMKPGSYPWGSLFENV